MLGGPREPGCGLEDVVEAIRSGRVLETGLAEATALFKADWAVVREVRVCAEADGGFRPVLDSVEVVPMGYAVRIKFECKRLGDAPLVEAMVETTLKLHGVRPGQRLRLLEELAVSAAPYAGVKLVGPGRAVAFVTGFSVEGDAAAAARNAALSLVSAYASFLDVLTRLEGEEGYEKLAGSVRAAELALGLGNQVEAAQVLAREKGLTEERIAEILQESGLDPEVARMVASKALSGMTPAEVVEAVVSMLGEDAKKTPPYRL